MLLQCDQQMHTFRYKVLKLQILHITGITVPSPGGAHYYKTMAQPLYEYNSQYIELSQVCQCISMQMDMCTVNGAACRFTVFTVLLYVCSATSKEVLIKAVFREACP